MSYEEAARVCLDRNHTPPLSMLLEDNGKGSNIRVIWAPTDEALGHAWANDIDATESGAYALALAAAELSRGLVAIRRAETLTGADYYVDRPGTPADDLETAIRLEVSGTADPVASVLNGRLRAKIDQARAGKSNLPAMAIVVGFSQARILCADVP